MNISEPTRALIESIKGCKGQFIRASYTTTIKTAAAHKGVVITKTVEGIFRSGIDYSKLQSVKSGIESGERKEVGELPWGEWLEFPWIIGHKGNEYIRLYPTSQVPTAAYEISDPKRATDRNQSWPATKEEVAAYLTPGDAAKLLSPDKERPEVICKKVQDVQMLGCWHAEVSDETIAQEEGAS
jgi:hypothetical protein